MWIPRTNGGRTLATVRQVLPPLPSLGDMEEKVYVTWIEKVPMHVHVAGLANPCVAHTDKVLSKWVPSRQCELV